MVNIDILTLVSIPFPSLNDCTLGLANETNDYYNLIHKLHISLLIHGHM